MKRSSLYGWGLILVLFGGAGMAENITSGRGNFMFCAVIFSIGISCVINSYFTKNSQKKGRGNNENI